MASVEELGFAERLGQLATSMGRAVWQAPGLVADLITAPFADRSEFEGLRDAWAARTAARWHAAATALGDAREAAGPVGDAAAAGVGVAMEGLEGIEEVTQRFVRKPLATALLAGSLADSESFEGQQGLAALFDQGTWRAAREMAEDITPGQAFYLMWATRDILDVDEVAQHVGTDLFHYATGTLDAVSRFFLDADVIGAKMLRAARTRYYIRPLRNDGQIDEFFRSDRWKAIDERIADLAGDDGRIHKVAQLLFPGDPLGMHKARFLADAPDTQSRELVLRGMMGDGTVAQRLRESAEAARSLKDAAEEAVRLRSIGRADVLPTIRLAAAEPAAGNLPPLFHGTSARFRGFRSAPGAGPLDPLEEVMDEVTPGRSEGFRNLFGPGFYATTSETVARSYRFKPTRGARGGVRSAAALDNATVYSVRWKGTQPPRILDVEEVADERVRATFRRRLDSELEGGTFDNTPTDDIAAFRALLDDEAASVADIYSRYKALLSYGSAESADDALHSLNSAFVDDLGFDAFRYQGGIRTGSDELHDAYVFLDESKVAVSRRVAAEGPTAAGDPGGLTLNQILDSRAALLNRLERMNIDKGVVTAFFGPDQRADAIFDILNDPSRWDLLEAEIRDINRQVGSLTAAEKLIASQPEELRLSILRGDIPAARDTAIYQTSAYRSPVRFVSLGWWRSRFTDARVHPVVDVMDYNAPQQVDRMLRMAGVPMATRERFMRDLMDASSAVDKAQVWDAAVEHGLRNVADDLGLDRKMVSKILAEAHKGRQRAQRLIERAYASGKRDLVPIEGDDGVKYMVALPLTRSQAPKHVTAPDFAEVRRTLERAQQKGWLPKAGSAVNDFANSVFNSITWHWKANVLLRLAWPIRVTLFDEQFRVMAKFGAAVHLAHAPQIARNTTAAYMKELGLAGNPVKAGKAGLAAGGALGFLTAGPAGAAVGGLAGAGLLRALSKLESAGFDAMTVRGLKVPPAFGEPGDVANVFYSKVSSGDQYDTLIRAEAPAYTGLRRDASRWQTIPADAPNHTREWLEVLNNQWRQDELARRIIAGDDDATLLRWLRSKEGRAYADAVPEARRYNPENWIRTLRAVVEDSTPSAELRRRLLEREITEADLNELFPDVRMRPDIHGAMIDEARGTSLHMEKIGEWIERGMDVLGTKPTDLLARQPAFNYFYRIEMERLIDSMPEAWRAAPDGKTMERLAGEARQRALAHARDLLYDLAERQEWHHMVRHFMPFLPASQEVLTNWAKIAVERPDFAVRAVKFWTGINKMDRITYTDPTTGEEYLTFPIPEWAKGIINGSPIFRSALDSQGRVRMPKDGFNMVLQSPLGFGPYVQAAVSEIVRNKPEWEEAVKIILPYGPTEDVPDAFLAGWQRNLRALWDPITGKDQQENRAYAAAWHRIFQTKIAAMRQGQEEMVDFDDPEQARAFEQEVTAETNALFALRVVAAFAAPSAPIFDSPLAPYIDAAQQLRNQYPDDWFERFIDQFGEEYIDVTMTVTESRDGVPPTMAGLRARERWRDVIEQHPDLGSFVMGLESGSMVDEYSAAAYDYQLNTPVAPGSDVMQRERLSWAERRAQPDVRMGWLKYQRAMEWIEAERISRGLPNLQVAEARDLMLLKQVVEERIAAEHPAWQEERSTITLDKWRDRFEGFWKIALDPRGADRPAARALRMYLEAREMVLEALRERAEAGGSVGIDAAANQDIAAVWQQMVASLVEQSVVFGDQLYRWFEHDPMTQDTSVAAIFGGEGVA